VNIGSINQLIYPPNNQPIDQPTSQSVSLSAAKGKCNDALRVVCCSLAADDVEEQVVTKTTKLVDKSASAAGSFVAMAATLAVMLLGGRSDLGPRSTAVVL